MRQLKLVLGHRHECSYLPLQTACSAYIDPELNMDTETYTQLAELGFRRSGDLVYRPHCPNCQECLPVRIPVRNFSPSRSQTRTLQANAEVRAIPKAGIFQTEHYELFLRYLSVRHDDGGMANSSPEEYMSFLGCRWAEPWFVEFRLGDELLAVAVVDRLLGGLSAVYTFFDPLQTRRGLGTLAVLWQVDEARRRGLDWVYLGYWIKDCRKMSYKEHFRALQVRTGGHWIEFEKGGKINAQYANIRQFTGP